MTMTNQPKYIQFPVSMLPEIFRDQKKFFNDVLDMGVFLYGRNINAHSVKVASQLLYHYSTQSKLLTTELKNFLEDNHDQTINNESFEVYEDRCSVFDSEGNFDCHGNDVLLAAILEANPQWLSVAGNWYRFIEGNRFIGNTAKPNFKLIQKMIDTNVTGQPLCMVKLSIVWDYYNHSKTQYELIQFACYAAIRSILGKRDCLLTNKQHIVARMFGAISVKTLPDKKHPLFDKYSNRYHIDKLLHEMESEWNLRTMNVLGLHGMYVSFTKTIDELAEYAELRQQKNKNQIQLLKDEKKQARERAKQKLMQNRS